MERQFAGDPFRDQARQALRCRRRQPCRHRSRAPKTRHRRWRSGMSQQVTRSMAPPMQAPWMAASTGLRQRSRLVRQVLHVEDQAAQRFAGCARRRDGRCAAECRRAGRDRCRRRNSCLRRRKKDRDPDFGVASTHAKAWRISSHMASVIALDLSGRSRRTSATPRSRLRRGWTGWVGSWSAPEMNTSELHPRSGRDLGRYCRPDARSVSGTDQDEVGACSRSGIKA